MSDHHAPDLNDKSAATAAQPARAPSSPRRKALNIALSILWLILAISLAQTSWQILHQHHASLPQFIWGAFYALAALIFVVCGCVGLRKALKFGKSTQA